MVAVLYRVDVIIIFEGVMIKIKVSNFVNFIGLYIFNSWTPLVRAYLFVMCRGCFGCPLLPWEMTARGDSFLASVKTEGRMTYTELLACYGLFSLYYTLWSWNLIFRSASSTLFPRSASYDMLLWYSRITIDRYRYSYNISFPSSCFSLFFTKNVYSRIRRSSYRSMW